MIDPRLQNKRANRIDNDDRVIVLRCDRLDQRVPIQPRRQVVPVYTTLVRQFFRKRTRGWLPVACISVHRDVALARVGLQEHNRYVLFYCRRGSANNVEVIKEPRK